MIRIIIDAEPWRLAEFMRDLADRLDNSEEWAVLYEGENCIARLEQK